MRRLSLVLVLFILSGSLLAQEGPQRGKFKKFDQEKELVTITTADGKDIECAILPQTKFPDADRQEIANFKKNGLPERTDIMYLAAKRDGRMVLLGIKFSGQRDGNRPNAAPAVPAPRDSIGVKPLPELGTETYKGETGGLYGRGSNDPPAELQQAARQAASRIRPLDAQGHPSATGKIGLLGIGMSNTTQEFSLFKRLADADPEKSDNVAIVDVAQGGQASEQWTDPSSDIGMRVWGTVAQRLKAADVSDEQVQVVWIKQATIAQGRFGEFPAHAKKLEGDLTTTLQHLKHQFPNLQLAFMSSRIYAGYATTSLNPEPYAYEGAFSIRWIIDAQASGDPALNYDPGKGDVKAPIVLWGPYLWGDGTTPRRDGLVWNRDDLSDRDGTHPSESGRKKVADMLTNFFHTEPFAKSWYLK